MFDDLPPDVTLEDRIYFTYAQDVLDHCSREQWISVAIECHASIISEAAVLRGQLSTAEETALSLEERFSLVAYETRLAEMNNEELRLELVAIVKRWRRLHNANMEAMQKMMVSYYE